MVGTETSHSHFKLLSTSPSGSSPNRWPTVGPVLSRAGVCVNLEMRERERCGELVVVHGLVGCERIYAVSIMAAFSWSYLSLT